LLRWQGIRRIVKEGRGLIPVIVKLAWFLAINIIRTDNLPSEEWSKEGDEGGGRNEDDDDEEEEEDGEEAIVEIGGASLARRYNGEVMRLSCSAR
jgi:hypothetical protein